jgi:hypothetical protein
MKALVIGLLCAACTSENVADDEGTGAVTLRPGVVIDPAVLTPGTIAISSEGDGYVRRVLADGTTEPASLFDAVTRARFQHAFTPDEIIAGDKLHEDLDVDVNAGIAFVPDVELAFELDEAGLVTLDLAISGVYAGTLDARLQQRATGGWNTVQTHEATPIRAKTMVDGLPVIIVARAVTDFAIYAGGDVQIALGSAGEGEVILDTHVHYDRTAGWVVNDASLRDVRETVTGTTPTRDARGNVTAVATTRFEVGLYDRRGAYVELVTTSRADAASCVALGEASISAGAGADASVLAPGTVMRHASLFRQVHPMLRDMPCE